MLNKMVALDRDGTLVRTFPQGGLPDRGPRTIEEIEYLPGVEDGCDLLRKAGYRLVILTNQPDVSRGIVRQCDVEFINYSIASHLHCSEVFSCFHDDKDKCCCRKPRCGLIYYAAVRHNVVLSKSWMIGDRDTDRLAAEAADLRFISCKSQSFLEAVQCILKT